MNVLITCGGTGGHIYPGIAIADKIKKENPNAKILFVGTKTGMENNLVPSAGYEIKGIDAKGIDRKHLLNNFKTLHDTLSGSKEMMEILDSFKPDLAIGTGGYVTGPVLFACDKKKIPVYVHESNAVPGVANKLIGEFARAVFVSFEETKNQFLYKNRVVLSGNPVREDVLKLDKNVCRKELCISENEKAVLIFGGSLGAKVINDESIAFIKNILKNNRKNIRLYFVTGNRFYEDVCDALKDYSPLPEFINILPYAYNMPSLMCSADLVIGRSGAITVSELAASKKASILIPSPNVTANHQFYNAKALADKNAAVLIEEKEILSGSKNLSDIIFSLLDEPEKLELMSKNAGSIAILNALDIIYKTITK